MKLLTELKVKIGYTEADIFQAIQKKYWHLFRIMLLYYMLLETIYNICVISSAGRAADS